MALKSWSYDGTLRRTGTTTTSYGRFDLSWSGLPENIRIKRVYWQWDISRQKGSVYARWYAGVSGSTLSGNSGVNAQGSQFDVTSITPIAGASGIAQVYLGAQYGWVDYSNISFNIEFDYLQSSFTLSTTNVEAGQSITANISIQDPNATHKATWQFGTRTSTTTTGAGVTANSLTIPLAWLDQIPNATSGLASCTLETINADGVSVGSSTLYFNILAPTSVVPSISSLTATRVDNEVPSAWNAYVQGQSGVRVKAVAAGAYGSTITGYTLTGDGKTTKEDTLAIARISGSGGMTFKATVTDSRGRAATQTLTISVVAWTSPIVRNLSVSRCAADGSDDPTGASIMVTLDGAISPVDGKNEPVVSLSYRLRGAATWIHAVEAGVASGSWVIAADAASPLNAYEVQAVLSDAFASATATALLPTAKVYLDKMAGRMRLGIGAYCPTDNTLYIAPEMAIHWGQRHMTPYAYNLLDNSDFRNPVNQRGQSSYTASVYGIDRWKGSPALVTLTGDGISLSISSGSWALLAQYVTDIIPGKTYTFAAQKTNGEIAVLTFTPTIGMADKAAAFSNEQETLVARYSTAANMFYIGFSYTGGSTMEMAWAALYEGEYTAETLPEYVPKGYGAELAECLRYYRVYATQGARPSSGVDCSPPMRLPEPTQGTLAIGGKTYYFNSADL